DTIIRDQDVNELIEKILPLLQKKIQENEGVLQKLTLLKNIRYFYGRAKRTIDTVDINGIWGLRLKRKSPIYSIYPFSMGGNYLDYNFSIINTLIYDGYELDGRTGEFKVSGESSVSVALKTAKQAGCKILLEIKGGGSNNIGVFLQNKNDQNETFVNNMLNLIREQHADGIDIDFKYLNVGYRNAFVTFIHTIYEAMRKDFPQGQLVISIPPGDKNSAYNINELNAPHVKFLIDFSTTSPGNLPGPPVYLKGGSDGIEHTASRYLNSNVPPSKFIICIPYYGSQWKINPGNGGNQFIKYLSLNEIASQYPEPTLYDPQTASAFINLMNDKKQLTGQIWYN
ncbi:MAG: glycoside hydrolase family 18 protein, partial [Chitinophagaceae bacterium]